MKLKLEMKGMKTYGMKLGWTGIGTASRHLEVLFQDK